ncbi:hypothetical protein K438DRAFT_1848979 [Mycena galopus ATCC 62051]|nr:hypothetical protein K438DRAFT_1848979 [Mycena galopus ATCC 62051]
MPPITFAYCCSGHGHGHATRVSAFASSLFRLPQPDRPAVHIVSSAPKHVFADSLLLGAQYRNANIDPVIVQPLAYRVDRQQSVAALKSFLDNKDTILQVVVDWLKEIKVDCHQAHAHFHTLIPDIPVSPAELEPLGIHHVDFYCAPNLLSSRTNPCWILLPADLLLRLPGYIPIPSFGIDPNLPSPKFHPAVFASLDESLALYPPVEYRDVSRRKPAPRELIPIPLLVRSSSPSVYLPTGRSKLLQSIGIPLQYHDPNSTKILVVSFGGQVFRRPGSASPSGRGSRPGSLQNFNSSGRVRTPTSAAKGAMFPHLQILSPSEKDHHAFGFTAPRLATASHLWIPGVPPASKPPTTPKSPRASDGPLFQAIPPTPVSQIIDQLSFEEFGWTLATEGDVDSDLPEGFFVAPRDVYMPDLTAVGDVLLGKLGYGTVAECVYSRTPFVYVSRPLFIEEHGLRRLLDLDHDGVGVELSRESYEAGDWAEAIETAWLNGRGAKGLKRKGREKWKKEGGGKLTAMVVQWAEKWGRNHV